MTYSLMIHGGAGSSPLQEKVSQQVVLDSMTIILEAGRKILEAGGSALEAVHHCVNLLENDPHYNAGHGARANSEGNYELDAAIMDGRDMSAGAVAAVPNLKNPIDLAALVKDKTPHVLLSGEGAIRFAQEHSVPIESRDYFVLAHTKIEKLIVEEHGTVGAVARDKHGNLAAATSTGGWDTKMPGRIGDTPIIGAGTWADNHNCAVSCTGVGEQFIRTGLAKHIAFLIEEKNMDAPQAAQTAIEYLVARVNGMGGFIVIDKNGRTSSAQSSDLLRHGWIENGGPTNVSLAAPIQVHRR
ncbi:MAG: isoaspartyl peptidase/L-asparaginase [Rhodospirillales bacterium]|nr:isoaspartyl peptidase/L-asparaginase [Rhodospirillales bacterium]